MSFQSFSMSVSPRSLVVYIPYLAKLLKWISAHLYLNKILFFPRLRNNSNTVVLELGIHLIPFLSLIFLDCKIMECLCNTACIHRCLQLKGSQYGVAFYLNCIRMCKPRNTVQALLNILCFPVCTCSPCLLLGQEEILCSNPPPRSGSFSSFCCESSSVGCSSVLWAKGCDLECRTKGYWKAGLGLFPAGAPSYGFISVPRGASALLSLLLSLLDTKGCTLRSKESL